VQDADATADAPGGALRIGPYRIEGPLGRGGMGEVHRAFDEALRRPVAIKRLAPALREDAVARARFWREARALAALSHPGVVRVHRIDETADGDLYLVMELIDGRPLADVLDRPWPVAAAAFLARAAADALGAAHAAGLTHRDVKPGNLLVERDGTPRVVDFGLARRGDGADERVTATGSRPGTPAYMAPEQIDGAPVGPPADVFALGTVLYRLLAGAHPFVRETPSATAMAVATARHKPLAAARPDVPAALAAVVERCLAADPGARYGDGAALAAALDATGLVGTRTDLQTIVDGGSSDAEAAASRSRGAAADGAPAGDAEGAAPAWALATAAPPAPSRWPWVAAVAVTLAGGATAFFLATRADDPPPLAVPPRPIVAVTEVRGDDGVFADALRLALDDDPEHLVSVPRATLAAAPSLDPKRLARPDRQAGNIDVALTGTLAARGDHLEATVDAVDTGTGRTLREWSVEGPADPVAFAYQVAPVVARDLGVTLPVEAPPTRVPGAWSALLAAQRAFAAGDVEAHDRNLEWSLHLDPDFALARLDELASLRADHRYDEAAKRGRALLATNLPPRLRMRAEALVALAEERGADAIRGLHALLDRWPYDVDAYETLMILRFYDPDHRDLAEVERLARRVLEIAPRHEDAASRLIRALAWRGRGDEAVAMMQGLGVPRDDVAFAEVWGELALYTGDYARAIADFGGALARAPEDLYAEHMAIAARLLSGDCEGAAVAALDRIQRVETTGHDANLDWTYSLAAQALVCRAQWGALDDTLDRWTKHGESGARQSRVLRRRVALLRGTPPAEVERAVAADLSDPTLPGAVRPTLLRLLARVSSDASALEAAAAAAEQTAVATGTPPSERRDHHHAAEALRARLAELRGDAKALDRFAALVGPWSAVRSEQDLGLRVEAMAAHAEALERAGRDAAPVWTELRALGYPRLWSTDLWLTAVRRLEGGAR
jgi:hypothetical protein